MKMIKSLTYKKGIRRIPTLVAVLLVPAGLTFADNEPRVFVVDNNGGPHADFDDLQEAVDGAEEGDVFHVLGSMTPYGDVTVTQLVHLFGPGYNLHLAGGEGYQDFLEARVGNVTFTGSAGEENGGSDFQTAAGSSISGFRVDLAVEVYVSDVTVKKNRISSQVLVIRQTVDEQPLSPDNARILQNFIENSGIVVENEEGAGHVVANNIMMYGTPRVRNALVRNNYIGDSLVAWGSTVESNILGGIDGADNLIRNNLIDQDGPGDPFLNNELENNIWEVAPYTLFVEPWFPESEQAYQLREDSPALGAGYGGVDAGPSGGPTPYQVSGVPTLPRVRLMQPPPVIASPSSELTISIRVEVE